MLKNRLKELRGSRDGPTKPTPAKLVGVQADH